MEENLRAFCSFLSSDPLFSVIITFYTLILLYFPSLFLHFIFHPVPISTGIILLSILRLGATQNSMTQETAENHDQVNSQQIDLDFLDHDHGWWISCVPDTDRSKREPSSNLFYADSFVKWDVRAPLKVIYEEDEGEEAGENDGVSQEKRESEMIIIHRYASLSLCYPESDGDNSSEGDAEEIADRDSAANKCFSNWEEEDDKDGLIEIALDEKRNCEVDEDNLIEIDLSPAKVTVELPGN